jgi:myo-inositol-1(or 4)-monophosphatase
MTSLMPTLERALDEAGSVLMHHYGALERVEQKRSDLDLVTIADRESEAAIRSIIAGAFPSHAILGEEDGGDRSLVAEGYRWIVDPLDGTTNYSHGFTTFAVSIAVEHRGQIVAAGVSSPHQRERFLAERGAGSTLNGARLRVSATQDLAKSLMVTGFPYDRRERIDHYLAFVRAFLLRAHGVLRLGSAALDLCSVAAGRLEGFWEEHLGPWDTAAGWLIVEEAGGRVTDFAGKPFSPFGTQTLATNGRIHQACLELIASVAP